MEINKNLINEDLYQSSESEKEEEEETSPEKATKSPKKSRFEEIMSGRIRPKARKKKK